MKYILILLLLIGCSEFQEPITPVEEPDLTKTKEITVVQDEDGNKHEIQVPRLDVDLDKLDKERKEEKVRQMLMQKELENLRDTEVDKKSMPRILKKDKKDDVEGNVPDED